MQAAEMMRGTRAVYDLVLLISLSIAYVHSFPIQVLPSIPGYIPVYIRYGDQPLEEVNPALAEAFHEAPSLSKTPYLDNISNSPDTDLEDDEDSEYFNAYSMLARAIRNRLTTTDEEKQPIEESTETKASGSVANAKKERRREKHRRKMRPNPVVKVNPLTDEEKEALEKLQIDVAEDIKSINNMQESSLKLSEVPSDKLPHKGNEDTTDPVIKVDEIIIDESDQPSTKNENPPASSSTNEKVPIKEQPMPNVLSNVHKVSPSPEILMKLEEERKAKESLEEKSK
ncbi:uncharacterized protein LOC143424528 [Xylocopa sonorina]|uniref:uncharacterized protein LOC143424528 n=1 Tax=Xylocopa sonorina TaxID=1818115 RepID=UPI00403AE3AB